MSGKLWTAFALLACLGCSDASRTGEAGADSAAAPAQPQFTMDQFRGLNFLVGNWQGTLPNGSLFFESYRLLNDTTIQMYAHPDSTFGAPRDSSLIYFSAGTIHNGPDARVERIDENGVHFGSTGAQRYVYVFKSTGPDSWTATLGADGQTVYHMTRVRP